MTEELLPLDNSIVQANIMTTGQQVMVPLTAVGTAESPLPEQTPSVMLKRLRQLGSFMWSTSDTGVIHVVDIEQALRTNTELAPLLKQFALYRANFKIVVRVNTNQFYSGALLVTHWPMRPEYGQYRVSRSVLHPVTISASTQQSAEIEIPYMYPMEWLFTNPDIETDSLRVLQATYVCFEVLAPLFANNPTLTDTVEVQLFAAYLDPKVAFNRDIEQQSGKAPLKEQKKTVKETPAQDARARQTAPPPVSFAQAAPTLSSIPILGDIFGGLYDIVKLGTGVVNELAPVVGQVAGPLLTMLLDKPENRDEPIRAVQQPFAAVWNSDAADPAVSTTYSRDSYLKAIVGQGVRMGNWSLQQYASIPGLAFVKVFSSLSTTYEYSFTPGPTRFTPESFLRSNFELWKSSFKVSLQFFASAFVSARLAISLVPLGTTSVNFDDFIVRIVDIKGDTNVSFIVPWVSNTVWQHKDVCPFLLHFRLLSPIVGPDATVDSPVYMVGWIAAANDFQVALQTDSVWNPDQTFPAFEEEPIEAQSAPQAMFATQEFTPIVDGCAFTLDTGFAVSDSPVTFGDVLKQYFEDPDAENAVYDLYDGGLNTPALHGITDAFICRRGGARCITTLPAGDKGVFGYIRGAGYVPRKGTVVFGVSGTTQNLAMPWIDRLPYVMKGLSAIVLEPHFHDEGLFEIPDAVWAFRDDLELGLPWLPPFPGTVQPPNQISPLRLRLGEGNKDKSHHAQNGESQS